MAWRLAVSQRARGMQATMLVGTRESNESFVYPFDPKPDRNLEEEFKAQGLLDYHLRGSDRLHEHVLFQEADVVHLHNLHGGFFNPFSLPKLSQRKPVIWTLHDMHPVTGHCAYSFNCNRWMDGCGNCPDLSLYPPIEMDATARLWQDKSNIYADSPITLVTPSNWLKKIVEKSILKEHPVELIYNGVDTRVFQPHNKEEMRQKFGLPKDKLIIGCVANIFSDARKGADTFEVIVRALGELQLDVLFLQIGGTANTSNDARIVRTGYVDDEHLLSEYYSAMDVFVFPSMADNCPLVLSEAMACGVPIVAYRTGGIPEIVQHGQTGWIAGQMDNEELVHHIRRLLTDMPLLQRMSAQAREQAVRHFDHEHIADQYEKVYEQAIGHYHNRNGSRAEVVARKPVERKVISVYVPGDGLETRYQDMFLDSGNLLFEMARDWHELIDGEGQFVYFPDQAFGIDPNFFSLLLKGYRDEDLVLSDLSLVDSDGHLFFRVMPTVNHESNRLDMRKKGCMIIARSYFKNHMDEIMNGGTVKAGRVLALRANAVFADLQSYLQKVLQPLGTKDVYIYGAGSHTAALLDHWPREWTIRGILDRSAVKQGATCFGLPLLHPSELPDGGGHGVLISSKSYETEIYQSLVERFPHDKIATMYQRFHQGDRGDTVVTQGNDHHCHLQ